MGTKHFNARLVPKDLNLLEEGRRVEVAKEIFDGVAGVSTFTKQIITGDETSVYEYDVKTVQKFSEWPFKNMPKAIKSVKSQGNADRFFDYRDQTVNKEIRNAPWIH